MPETDSQDFERELALIAGAARRAGEIAMRYFRASPEVWMKHGQSPVSEADLAANAFLHEHLIGARPDHGWLSEETADSPDRLGCRRTFVVDPIDGTRAFIDGHDTWCVSIAVVENGRPIAGVLDCPALGHVYTARRNGPALRNGIALSVASLPDAPLVAGPAKLIEAAETASGRTFRRKGHVPSLAIRIAMIAAGELDATFVKANSHDWDLAAADMVLEMAGGGVRDSAGGILSYAGPDPRRGLLVAGSEPLLSELGHSLASEQA